MADKIVELVLIACISLLSFSLGTVVGQAFKAHEQKLTQEELNQKANDNSDDDDIIRYLEMGDQ